MQRIIEIAQLVNGAHRNQTFHGSLPEGWAVIPGDMELPVTFPFVELEVKDVVHYRDAQVLREVTRTREVPTFDEEGNIILDEAGEPVLVPEEYTAEEWVTEQEPYTVPTVVSMTEGIMPEPTPKPEPGPSQLDRVEAQVTYTAMMTDTLLEV